MNRFIVMTPAVVEHAHHVDMVRLQSIQHAVIKLAMKKIGASCYSAIVFDRVASGLFERCLDYTFDIKIFPHQKQNYLPNMPHGIRRPVNYFLKELPNFINTDNLYVIRIIQDTFIFDFKILMEDLSRLGPRTIGGIISSCDDINDELSELKLCPRSGRISYVQGAFMAAEYDVWSNFYLNMPLSIFHYKDDSIMSEWLVQEGGKLEKFSESLRHFHDISGQQINEVDESLCQALSFYGS